MGGEEDLSDVPPGFGSEVVQPQLLCELPSLFSTGSVGGSVVGDVPGLGARQCGGEGEDDQGVGVAAGGQCLQFAEVDRVGSGEQEKSARLGLLSGSGVGCRRPGGFGEGLTLVLGAGVGDQVPFGGLDGLCGISGLGKGGELRRQSGKQLLGHIFRDDGLHPRRLGTTTFRGSEDADEQGSGGVLGAGAGPGASSGASQFVEGHLGVVLDADGDGVGVTRFLRRGTTGDQGVGVLRFAVQRGGVCSLSRLLHERAEGGCLR
ncbi:hypothetical protein [Streptomyces sp. MNU89]|uniref:hypothetical protein n=1 Tax=Streptomyces sp. MNU89 TaxID=2560025 RepID=UPI001E2E0798|nr:hypothetical protein [Streptomyces sp. MNU89]MCC9738522.1 hypothetical protein [Streptomyces sp. MNU89]